MFPRSLFGRLVLVLAAGLAAAALGYADRIRFHLGDALTLPLPPADAAFTDPADRTIDIQVSRLRHRLDDDPADPKIIKTVRGEGYVLAVAVEIER